MEGARKGAGGEGCARAALPPQGNAARPARQGGARANEVSARARDRVRDRARGICCDVPAAQRGGTAAPDSGQEAHTTMRRRGGTFMPPHLRPCADRR